MIEPLRPGDRGIDYSEARPDLATAAGSGARFVIRYSAGAASDPNNASHGLNAAKLITPAEFQAILAAGLDVIANDEWYETRVTEGFAAGVADATAAAALWKSCGYAQGATIYASWDAYPAKASWWKVGRYVSGYRKGLAGYYQVDAYAGTGFLRWAVRHTLVRFGWRPNAGNWSGDGLPYQPDTSTPEKRSALVALARKKTPAHLWQTGNYWFGQQADEDMIVRVPVGSHNEALIAAQGTPAQPPDPGFVEPKIPHFGGRARLLVSEDGSTMVLIHGDGRVALRHKGQHVGWLAITNEQTPPKL